MRILIVFNRFVFNVPYEADHNFVNGLLHGGVTATAGGLVFATGTLDNKIRAFNSDNGKELWSYKLPFSGSSPPTIYEYNNEQYILVPVTGSVSLRKAFPEISKSGNKIYAFRLKR